MNAMNPHAPLDRSARSARSRLVRGLALAALVMTALPALPALAALAGIAPAAPQAAPARPPASTPEPSAAPRAPATPAPSAPAAPAPVAPGTPSTPAPTPPASAPAPDETPALPPLPATPAVVDEIVFARPFTVDEPWPSDWCADHAEVREGWIVVLRAKRDLVVPRQTEEPVLLAGGRTAERVSSDPERGLIVAIVPATARRSAVPGRAATDEEGMRPLGEIAFWFGTPGLPEQVDSADFERELRSAEAAKIAVRPAEEVATALDRGGAALRVADRAALVEVVRGVSKQHGLAEPADDPAAE